MEDVFTHLFDGVDNPSSGLKGFFDSITIVLSTPCELLARVFAMHADEYCSPVRGSGCVGVELDTTSRRCRGSERGH